MVIQQRIASLMLVVFFQATVLPVSYAQEVVVLPNPGVMVDLSPGFVPPHLAGISVYPNSPLKFDFLIQRGDTALSDQEKQEEYTKLIKYFLASLAVPDENQWVNLSPYEKDRIVGPDFANTLMGRDLLGQDYILKQITSSLIYPEKDLGKDFWDRVYAEAFKQFGNTNIPVNTFNKVWIVPDSAVIYEKGNSAYVLKNHLKVMLEQDYVATEQNAISDKGSHVVTLNASTSKVMRDVIIPVLEKEVNEGKNFANLRQVYSGMLLAAWYKRVLKESFLAKIYADKSKIKGVNQDPKANQEIYQRYLQATKKGVYNFIKEDMDKYTQQIIPRKYFSGGAEGYKDFAMVQIFNALTTAEQRSLAQKALLGTSGSGVDIVGIGFEDSGSVDLPLDVALDFDLGGDESNSVSRPEQRNTEGAPKKSYDPNNYLLNEVIGNLRSPRAVQKNGYVWLYTSTSRALNDKLFKKHFEEAIAFYKKITEELIFEGNQGSIVVSLKSTEVGLPEVRMKFKDNFVNIFRKVSYPKNNEVNLKALSEAVANRAEEILSENDREVYDRASISSVNFGRARLLGNAIYSGLLVVENVPDEATPSAIHKDWNKGGIDFNASKLNMQIKRDGNGIVLPMSQQNWENIIVEGLIPVIINIKPVLTLPIFSQN